MKELEQHSLDLLRRAYGPNATFREGQWEAVSALLRPGARLLVVQRTGWGKSVVYFLATKLLRDLGKGPTLIVSPLIALMRNQQEMAQKLCVRAASIHSGDREGRFEVEEALRKGSLDLLLVSPERLADRQFVKEVLPLFENNAGLIVIDEAHCISDWGHDFRPDYRRLARLPERFGPECAVLATTATANNRVIVDLESQLGPNLEVQRGPLDRPGLRLSVFHFDDPAERLAWLAKYIPKFQGTGIVYALTVADAQRTADWLQKEGIDAYAYHGDLPDVKRRNLETGFAENRLKALVATTALGMGYDKRDVAFVVHSGMPGSPLAYYQQVGRAGRDLDISFGAMLCTPDDADTSRHFMESALPPKWVFEALRVGLKSGPKTLSECLAGLSHTPQPAVLHALEVLEAEGMIIRMPNGFALANHDAGLDWDRVDAIRAEREHELEQMQLYVRHAGCRMQLLLAMLDDAEPPGCGRCDVCLPHAPISLDNQTVERARAFLHSSTFVIRPIEKLPSGVDVGRQKTLKPAERLKEGIALCSYNDPGWGRMVRQGKYEALEYSEELVHASARAIRGSGFSAKWLTWAPSTRHGKALESFARKLADALEIEAVDSVCRVQRRAPQKTMSTAETQFLNAWGAFRAEHVRPGPCLLVDDLVDSGWTLAVIGLELLKAGSGPVMPFALATARPRRTSS